MNKNVKPGKKSESKFNIIFAAERCTGKTLAVVTVLKMLEMILVTIFGLFLGIFAPLCVFLGINDAEASTVQAAVVWLISSVLYIAGFFALMLGNSRIAMIIQGIAAVGTLVTYSIYSQMFSDNPNSTGPSMLYMPCLFIAMLTLAIMLVINIPKWFDKRQKMLSEKAPSILGDENNNDKKE